MEDNQSLAELLTAWWGGATTTIVGALLGRAMWHATEARKARRRFLGPELMWELPIALGMAFIGDAVAVWLNASQPVSTGLIAAIAYLGPRGAEVYFAKWFGAKIDK